MMPGAAARWSSSPCPRRRRRVNAKSAWILPSSSIGRRSTKCRREGRYLLRSNWADTDPAKRWEFYLQLSDGRELVFTRYAARAGSTLPTRPNSDGACPSRPDGAPCKIRRRIVGQTFYIRPLNPLRFLLPTRPRAKDRLGSGAVHSPDHRDMKVPPNGEGLPARLARPIAQTDRALIHLYVESRGIKSRPRRLRAP